MASRAKGFRGRLAALESATGPTRPPIDRLEFAWSLGFAELDPWQERLLSSTAPRILLNCCRQSGKSTMASIAALHRALYCPESLVLLLAPSERQARQLFSKISAFDSTIAAAEVVPTES